MEKLDFFKEGLKGQDLVIRVDEYIKICEEIMDDENKEIRYKKSLLTELRRSLNDDARITDLNIVEKKFGKSRIFRTFRSDIRRASVVVTGQVKNQQIGYSAAGIKQELQSLKWDLEDLLDNK